MRYHFGYAKAEVEAMPWYDSWSHREYLADARAEAQADAEHRPYELPANRRFQPDESLPVEDGRPAPWDPDASPVPSAASRPRPTHRSLKEFDPDVAVTERDGDAATLRADGFTVLPWTGN